MSNHFKKKTTTKKLYLNKIRQEHGHFEAKKYKSLHQTYMLWCKMKYDFIIQSVEMLDKKKVP